MQGHPSGRSAQGDGEARALKRRHLVFYLQVFDEDSDRLLGKLVDITTRGMMLLGGEPTEEGRAFRLRMALPSRIAGRETLTFSARSVWCRPDVNPEYHLAGFEFQDLGALEEDIINHLIQRVGFQD